MQNNRNKNKSFLGHKRNDEEKKKEENIINEKEKQNKKISLKLPELNDKINDQKNNANSNEEKDEKCCNFGFDKNQSLNLIQTNQNKICEKCGHGDNVLIFNSFKDILDYFNKNHIKILFKNNVSYEKFINIQYEKPRNICANCLLELTKNQTDFDKFLSVNKSNFSDNNENPFINLYNNSNLKNFNNKEKLDNNRNNNISSFLNGQNKEFFGRILTSNPMNVFDNQYTNSGLNDTSKNNINKIFQDNNSIYGDINTLNGQFLLSNNYNIPFVQKFGNLNIPNYMNNNVNNNLFNQNNIFKNLSLQDNNNIINPNSPIQYYILNYPDFLQISHLNQPLGFIPYTYNEISNTNGLQSLNKDNYTEKSVNINTNIDDNKKEKIKNDEIKKENNNIQKCENDQYKNLVMIENKDFDEIFQLTSSLYHKLLDIKIKRVLNLDLSKLNQNQYNQFFSSNYFNPNKSNKEQSNNNLFDLNNKSNNNFNQLFLRNLTDLKNSHNMNGINKSISGSNNNETNNNSKTKTNEINDLASKNSN